MTVPRQVEEAAELALNLHAQMNAPEEKEDEKPEEEVEEKQEEVVEVKEDPKPEEDYKHRYDTLQGKYNAEVPRLHKELKELKERVFAQLGEMSQKQAEPKPTTPDPDDARLAKYKEEYGEEMLEMQRLLARKEAESRVQALLNERLTPVQEQVQSVEEAQVNAAKTNFVGYLDGEVKGDWKKLWSGQDPKFLEFLAQPDPSGYYTNGQLAEMFNENWDGEKLARLFNSYIETSAPKPPAVQAPAKPAEPAKPKPAQEAMIAPSRQTPHNTPVAEEKKVWTQDSIREFQRNDRAGKYDAEMSKALWEDLLSAPSQNRIRG